MSTVTVTITHTVTLPVVPDTRRLDRLTRAVVLAASAIVSTICTVGLLSCL